MDRHQEDSQAASCSSGVISVALGCMAKADRNQFQRAFLQIAGLFNEQDEDTKLAEPDSTVEKEKDLPCTSDTWDKTQEETFDVKLQHISVSVPLYQEYWRKCILTELLLEELAAQRRRRENRTRPRPQVVDSLPTQNPTCASSPPDSVGVQPELEDSRHTPSPICSSYPLAVSEAPYSLWQHLPEVTTKNFLHKLSDKEIGHQEAMFELMVSEASYQRSLRVAVGLFQSSAQLKRTLTPMDYHVLFSNLMDVYRVSRGFLHALESRMGQNVFISTIGDVILTHMPIFETVYVPYITKIIYQEALMAKLLQGNKTFVLVLKQLEKNPLCQRWTLMSFLFLPFQRITKLLLILENILNGTSQHMNDMVLLPDAIKALQRILVQCDHNVLQMKRTEELVQLERLVDFAGMMSIPLVVIGRYLIRQGPLKKLTAVTNPTPDCLYLRTDVYLHLFNDLLLLSITRWRHDEAACSSAHKLRDYAVFPAQVHVEKIKRTLGLPPDSFRLCLAPNHLRAATELILVASTGSEKDDWIRFLKVTR